MQHGVSEIDEERNIFAFTLVSAKLISRESCLILPSTIIVIIIVGLVAIL